MKALNNVFVVTIEILSLLSTILEDLFVKTDYHDVKEKTDNKKTKYENWKTIICTESDSLCGDSERFLWSNPTICCDSSMS